MFGLFKKKKQQTKALIEKDEHSGSDNGAADIAARTASNQATQIQMQKAAQTFAKPSQYTGNRNLFDSESAKRRAKEQAFANGQRPVDPYLKTELAGIFLRDLYNGSKSTTCISRRVYVSCGGSRPYSSGGKSF